MERQLYKLIADFINYPVASICKHYVCLCILDMLERQGYELNDELVKSINDADDEKTLQILKLEGN